MKILLTSGPTQEPLDSVRYLTNMSSGATGSKLADFFIAKGHDVLFVHGVSSKVPQGKSKNLEFRTFKELDSSLQNILREEAFDFVVHLAAVGDYSVKEIRSGNSAYEKGASGKIESSAGELTVKFYKNFKIIHKLSEYSKVGSPKIIGFKLTDSHDENIWKKAAEDLFSGSNLSLVVHNDVRDINSKKDRHSFRIYNKELESSPCESVNDLGIKLLERMESGL